MILRILEQDIPGLTAVVEGLDACERRTLTRAAAELALRVSPVEDPRVDEAWAALDSDADAARLEAVEQLQQLVHDLDDVAAAFQIELDEMRERGKVSERAALLMAEYGRAFAQARACETLLAALDPVLDEALQGALYEANAALDHAPAAIRALVDAVADGRGRPVDTALRQMNLG